MLVTTHIYEITIKNMDLNNIELRIKYMNNDDNIIKCQYYIRKYLRKNKLPLILRTIQNYLKKCDFKCATNFDDGRINSNIDEKNVIDLIKKSHRFRNKIKKTKDRMWYDILLCDEKYGWIPVNIKSSTLKTCDNVGNLSVCVQSYTNYKLDYDEKYNNGKLSKILFSKLQNGEYNSDINKDYYYLVINKNNPNDIIINSTLGLSKITRNMNNLPYQIKWSDNKEYKCHNILDKIKIFVNIIKQSKPCWRENFLHNMRSTNFTFH